MFKLSAQRRRLNYGVTKKSSKLPPEHIIIYGGVVWQEVGAGGPQSI